MIAITAQTALEHEPLYITTYSKNIDRLLGGGVALGSVTEICGMPGLGKTQLSMQLCATVQIPNSYGGREGEVIYMDTEGSFNSGRMKQIANSMLDWIKQEYNHSIPIKDVLNNIKIYLNSNLKPIEI